MGKERKCPYCDGSGVDCGMTGGELAALLKAHGVKQRELARRMNVSDVYVSDMRHGRRKIGPEIARRIRRALPMNGPAAGGVGSACRAILDRVPAAPLPQGEPEG